jgi:enoyl-CoA hydratase
MITVTTSGDIFEIVIDNPQHANAVSDEMAADLIHALEEAGKSARLAIVRGAGADFCTGRMSMGEPQAHQPEALERRRKTQVIFDCYDAFRQTPVPVLGVVKGRAHGFGCAIAALCDITLAADTATFKIPEMAHNILPTMVMSALVDRVPRKVLSYLVYSTAQLSADEALRCGLASKVAPEAELDGEVAALIATMLKAPQPALRGVKDYARSAYDMPIRGAIDYARNLHATVNSSSEMKR